MKESPSLPPWRYGENERGGWTIKGMYALDNEHLADVYETIHQEGEANARLMTLSREIMDEVCDILYFWDTDNESHPDREAAMHKLQELYDRAFGREMT